MSRSIILDRLLSVLPKQKIVWSGQERTTLVSVCINRDITLCYSYFSVFNQISTYVRLLIIMSESNFWEYAIFTNGTNGDKSMFVINDIGKSRARWIQARSFHVHSDGTTVCGTRRAARYIFETSTCVYFVRTWKRILPHGATAKVSAWWVPAARDTWTELPPARARTQGLTHAKVVSCFRRDMN